MKVVLDGVESKIFRLLLDCVADEQLPVVLRAAGGWVRDKLLGLSSHDIDIAIDRMMGRCFVDHLLCFISSKNASDPLQTSTDISGVGTIKSNPEKSKHLETATMVLYGVKVDFVNLRSESYAEEHHPLPLGSSPLSSVSSTSSSSRIPIRISFGSPLEDANRRDITINALFYNLHTEQIEDWNGRGLDDLREGLVRTPLDPLVTLMDDPLRLLRIIRFAARFDYRIVDELENALHNSQVHRSFRMKVSRERVGIEVDKMLSHVSVQWGMSFLLHEKIYPLLFLQSHSVDCDRLWQLYCRHFLAYQEDSRLAAYCALFMPLAERSSGKESATLLALKSGLKLPSRDYLLVARVVDGLFAVTDADINCPVSVGRAIMAIGEHWRLSCRTADGYSELHSLPPSTDGFLQAATKFRLTTCFQWKPLLNGDDVKSLFGVNGGPQVGVLLQRAVDLQLANPEIGRTELIDKLTASSLLLP